MAAAGQALLVEAVEEAARLVEPALAGVAPHPRLGDLLLADAAQEVPLVEQVLRHAVRVRLVHLEVARARGGRQHRRQARVALVEPQPRAVGGDEERGPA